MLDMRKRALKWLNAQLKRKEVALMNAEKRNNGKPGVLKEIEDIKAHKEEILWLKALAETQFAEGWAEDRECRATPAVYDPDAEYYGGDPK